MYNQLYDEGRSFGQRLKGVPLRNLLGEAFFNTKDDLQESHEWHTLHALKVLPLVGLVEALDPRARWRLCYRDCRILRGYKLRR